MTGSFWRTLVRFEREKLEPWLALRNSIGVVVPLALGVAAGSTTAAFSMSMGALNVSFSDSHEPYLRRARRMIAATTMVSVAVFAGEYFGRWPLASVGMAAAWAFAAGMMVALSPGAADVGTISLVTMLVYSAYPAGPEQAAVSASLAFAGGVLQTALALSLWPLRRYVPERKALARLYEELGRAASARSPATEAPPATAASIDARHTLATLDRSRAEESERYRMLLGQAERMRLGMLALSRLRTRIERENPDGDVSEILPRYFEISSEILDSVARWLNEGRAISQEHGTTHELEGLAERMRGVEGSPNGSGALAALAADARHQMDALTGQLRSALDLGASATVEGAAEFVRRETRRPWRLRLSGTIATLRANLTPKSAAFRHAIRLSACVAAGEAVARAAALQRSYWLPMTVAIVLKPDFTATFSRGVLRLAGTFAGLVFATGLLHALPASHGVLVAEVGVLMYAMRYAGPANYGVMVTAVTGLVVALMSLTGIPPSELIAARALNTAAGGAIALAAYALWPTWEKRQVPEVLAQLLDAYRNYFRAIQRSYTEPDSSLEQEVDRRRQEARLARSNFEASMERIAAEPGTDEETRASLSAILANSHRLVHAIMALEAGLATSRPAPARAPFRPFARDVELTLFYLASALRGSSVKREDLPDLRERHHALVNAGGALTERYALVNIETDRITNSLNTLSEEILRYAG